ncbi:hypothetical protein B0H13DRAFT_2360945 [Mycena leptocephala]|nr:hypothetical protein B0H13DRAFT_2360945 [Mycena leptocephala]
MLRIVLALAANSHALSALVANLPRDTSASQCNGTTPDMGKSCEMQGNATIPITAEPLFPPPSMPCAGATSEFGGKSLPALFPSVESKIILDIVSHAFMPLDLPRLLSPLAARQDYVAPPSSAPASEHSLALKHFPSFHSLLRPLLKYFEVLAAFAASSGKPWEVFAITRSLSDYVSHLTELHQQYKWSAVVIYHVEFHNTRLWDMKAGDYSGWALPDYGKIFYRLVK